MAFLSSGPSAAPGLSWSLARSLAKPRRVSKIRSFKGSKAGRSSSAAVSLGMARGVSSSGSGTAAVSGGYFGMPRLKRPLCHAAAQRRSPRLPYRPPVIVRPNHSRLASRDLAAIPAVQVWRLLGVGLFLLAIPTVPVGRGGLRSRRTGRPQAGEGASRPTPTGDAAHATGPERPRTTASPVPKHPSRRETRCTPRITSHLEGDQQLSSE
jgi:hypothetical protein